MSFSLSYVGVTFFSHFCLCPACRKSLVDKTYPTMDVPVNGESDGVNCILVEDCI